MTSILDWMDELVSKFWDKILDFLPGDPFQDIIASLKYGEISKYFGYINFFSRLSSCWLLWVLF